MKLVILDRDGVINVESDDFIKSPEEWHPIPGSLEAISRLCREGFSVALATNQSGIGRGYFDVAVLNAIHNKMTSMLAKLGGKIEFIAYCPHLPDDNCYCRKPQPGLLQEIATHFGLSSLTGIPMVGDNLKDLLAAEAAGCLPILVETGKGMVTKKFTKLPANTLIYPDLESYTDALVFESITDERNCIEWSQKGLK